MTNPLWQTVEVKAASIEQFRNGTVEVREIEDVTSEAANHAEMKAAATGNKMIFTQVKLLAELKKVEAIFSSFRRSQHHLQDRIKELEAYPALADRDILRYKKEIENRDKNTLKDFYFKSEGRVYDDKSKKEILTVFATKIKQAEKNLVGSPVVGTYRGFNISVEYDKRLETVSFNLEWAAAHYTPQNLGYHKSNEFNVSGFFKRIDNFLGSFEGQIELIESQRIRKAEELINAKNNSGRQFAQMDLLEALKRDNKQVMIELSKMKDDRNYKSVWIPESDNASRKKISLQL